ncbi:hypothetical protein L3Q67_35375 [Saccharothrix sp. AJ9571]|nr:hypothetical protein L3Q67_35375 [Saccharothrix sp. AJ9571]
MRSTTGAAVLAAAGVAAGTAFARKLSPPPARNRWLAVTVNLPQDTVERHEHLRAFTELADRAETRVRQAPGGKGTELAARLREEPPSAVARVAGADPRQEVRTVLREVKSLLETGEVVQPDEPTTGKPTPGGRLVRFATRRAQGEGRL